MPFTTQDFPERTFNTVEEYKEALKKREEMKKKLTSSDSVKVDVVKVRR